MKIKTITCHNVYNLGASLQAYALAEYLRGLGHDARIIDYRPGYLCHYGLSGVANRRFDKPVLRQLYNFAKLPGRLRARYGRRKRRFDRFTAGYLPLSDKCYDSYEALAADPPEADIYIAGSDQIWNTFFPNGRDPSFYLDFAPSGRVRASYAASFSVEHVDPRWQARISGWLSRMDHISVRETSGLGILEELGIRGGRVVLDPVFLLSRQQWERLCGSSPAGKPYILVYDFDGNHQIRAAAETLAAERDMEIYTLHKLGYGDRCVQAAGPLEFLSLIQGAGCVLSNSFHATAFSLIFEKPFWVFDRREHINTRMRDLLAQLGLSHRLIRDGADVSKGRDLDYREVDRQLHLLEQESKQYLDTVLTGECHDR